MENKKLEYLHLLTSKEINLPRLEHDEDGSMQKEDTKRVQAIQRILKGYINGDQTKKTKENIKNNFDALEELLSIYKMSISAITKGMIKESITGDQTGEINEKSKTKASTIPPKKVGKVSISEKTKKQIIEKIQQIQ